MKESSLQSRLCVFSSRPLRAHLPGVSGIGAGRALFQVATTHCEYDLFRSGRASHHQPAEVVRARGPPLTRCACRPERPSFWPYQTSSRRAAGYAHKQLPSCVAVRASPSSPSEPGRGYRRLLLVQLKWPQFCVHFPVDMDVGTPALADRDPLAVWSNIVILLWSTK